MDQMKNLDYNTLHLKNKDYVDQMKILDCNQIKILSIYKLYEKKNYIYFENLKI